MKVSITRKQFVAQTALGLAGLAIGVPAFARRADEPIRIGIIGTGSRGVGLATLLKTLPGVELLACCDVLPENLKRGMAHASPRAKAYTDHRKLLEDKRLNAVVIATPLFLHHSMAVDALNAGKHIFLEKAMAFDIPQVLDLSERVKQSGLVFQVGFQYRNYGLYHKVKQMIADNWLGKITHFECQYNQNSPWRKPVSDPKLEKLINWRMYREFCGGPLTELCGHQLDAVNFLLEEHPLKVTAMGGINYWQDGRETHDNIRAIYQYPGGIMTSVTSVLSNGYNGYNIRVLGDKATVEIHRNRLFIYPEPVKNVTATIDGVTGATLQANSSSKELTFDRNLEPTIYALEEFVDCIRTKRTPLSNVDTARETTIALHLGNLAVDTETVQKWKPEYSAK